MMKERCRLLTVRVQWCPTLPFRTCGRSMTKGAAGQCASWLVFDAFFDACYAWLLRPDWDTCSWFRHNMNQHPTMFHTNKDWTGWQCSWLEHVMYWNLMFQTDRDWSGWLSWRVQEREIQWRKSGLSRGCLINGWVVGRILMNNVIETSNKLRRGGTANRNTCWNGSTTLKRRAPGSRWRTWTAPTWSRPLRRPTRARGKGGGRRGRTWRRRGSTRGSPGALTKGWSQTRSSGQLTFLENWCSWSAGRLFGDKVDLVKYLSCRAVTSMTWSPQRKQIKSVLRRWVLKTNLTCKTPFPGDTILWGQTHMGRNRRGGWG